MGNGTITASLNGMNGVRICSDMIIYETRNYEIFSFIFGNRVVSTARCLKIRESLKRYGAIEFIMFVNDAMEIIDGQHRFQEFVKAGLPVKFLILKDYGLSEVHIYNQHQADWSVMDFAKSYAEQGIEDYQIYLNFKIEYRFGHLENLSLLSGIPSLPHRARESFRTGEWRVKNLRKAHQTAQKILQFGDYQGKVLYPRFRRRYFVHAVSKLLDMPNYNHTQMLKKLSFQTEKLTDQVNREHYLSCLEKIYNFKQNRSKYVRFDI